MNDNVLWKNNIKWTWGERFDLTIWDRQVDKCPLPFSKNSQGVTCDSEGTPINLYPDVRECLYQLEAAKIPVAIASRITNAAGAYQLLHLLDIRKYFQFVEIYPTGKRLHFRRMKQKTQIEFGEMLFFDDMMLNIKDISRLGVRCVLVEGGLTMDHLAPRLQNFTS